jgi:hypothetical protein
MVLLVVTVNVELAELPFGVTDAGEKIAVAPVGSPEIDSVIAFANAPFTGVSVMGYCALAPRATVCGLFEAPIEKSVTGGDMPAPVSWTLWGEPAALSATEIAAE